MRDRDERVLQGRREIIETLAEKDEKNISGSMEGDEQGRVDGGEREKEEMEPYTLSNNIGKWWLALGLLFISDLSRNWMRIKAANNSPCK